MEYDCRIGEGSYLNSCLYTKFSESYEAGGGGGGGAANSGETLANVEEKLGRSTELYSSPGSIR